MLFGTDGIRGIICDSPKSDDDSITDLLEKRSISPRFMRLVGEALSRFTKPNSNVIIGWDDRPKNFELAKALTIGLKLGNCKVIHAGLCATPGLHNAMLETKSAFGCMITASHNPVSESGIKIFDKHGFKTNVEIEQDISELIIQIAAEDREVDTTHLEELEKPNSSFDADKNHRELISRRYLEFKEIFSEIRPQKILLDCSKGAPSAWLADFLCEVGLEAVELSSASEALNKNCGAGELSPTDSWSWEEVGNSDHILIKSLEETEPGKIIAAALDGDGDRCLLIESTDYGCRVIDGDEMADHILRAAKGNWTLAASIESDLALSASLSRLTADVKFVQTAVGDRWLSDALKNTTSNKIGVEDSGHIVLSAPNPNGGRCLVGDGAVSLLATLSAMAVYEKPDKFIRGFKKRVSIKDTKRERWDGKNLLSNNVEKIIKNSLDGLQRKKIAGESNLLLLEGSGISFGIRNSGTQAKTNVSLRLAPNISPEIPLQVMDDVIKFLTKELV